MSAEASDPPPVAIEAVGVHDDVDEDEFEAEEYDGASAASTSITSSIMQHEHEHGRRYMSYKNSRYPIPNDNIEQSREDMKHAMMMELTDGKLFFADIGDHPQKIIDLGTGTGIWAIDVADQYPSAEVTGIDMTPIQPGWVPPNLKFIVDDIEKDWLNGSDFDLVHLRQIMPVLKDPSTVISRSFENIKPGGWIEIQEFGGKTLCDDNSMPEDHSVLRFTDLCDEAMAKFGAQFRVGNRLQEPLEKAGFVNITCKRLKAPIGTWPKDKQLRLVGLYMRNIVESLLGAMGGRPFAALGMSEAEIQVFLATVRRDLRNTEYHTYLEYLFWTGQKPEVQTPEESS